MPDISFVDNSIKKTLYKEISIQASLNGFSFLIRSDNQKYLAFKHYIFKGIFLADELIRKVGEIMKEDPILQSTFSKTTVTYISQKSTFVPQEYFDVNQAKKLFEFNQSLDELDELHFNPIETIGSVNLFAIPNYLANELSRKFDQKIHYQHQSTHLVNVACKIHQDNTRLKFFVNVNKGFFDLLVMDNYKMLLCNSYPYVHQTDFVYFLLYAAKELGYEAHTEEFVFMGEHSGNNHLIEEVQNYLGQIHYIDNFIDTPVDIKKYNFREFFVLR